MTHTIKKGFTAPKEKENEKLFSFSSSAGGAKAHRAFTLIELLVVIAIIGILSSVVLASLNDARLKSRDAKRIADVKQLQLALELYYDSNNGYPAALSSLATQYIAAVPTDPIGSAAYFYESLSSGTDYNIGVNLEQSGHTVLGSDVDSGNGGTINAADTADCETGLVTTRYCYSLKP